MTRDSRERKQGSIGRKINEIPSNICTDGYPSLRRDAFHIEALTKYPEPFTFDKTISRLLFSNHSLSFFSATSRMNVRVPPFSCKSLLSRFNVFAITSQDEKHRWPIGSNNKPWKQGNWRPTVALTDLFYNVAFRDTRSICSLDFASFFQERMANDEKSAVSIGRSESRERHDLGEWRKRFSFAFLPSHSPTRSCSSVERD